MQDITDPSSCVTSNATGNAVVMPGSAPRFPSILLPDGNQYEPTEKDLARLWFYVAEAEDGCWNWTGSGMSIGYGRIHIKGRGMYPHRVTHMLFKGPIPAGLHIDHLCRNRLCCNPAHLEPVTVGENIHRSPIAQAALNALKTHCPRGHELAPGNLIERKQGRTCRTCANWLARIASARREGRAADLEALLAGETPDRAHPTRGLTHCPHGHPFDEANTYIDPKGGRRCRKCRVDGLRDRKKRPSAQANREGSQP